MKKTIAIMLTAGLLWACKTEKAPEERFVLEGDAVTDVDTGDKFIMDQDSTHVTVIHQDGSKEVLDLDKTPFYGTTVADEYYQKMEDAFQKRIDDLIEQKNARLQEARKARYAAIGDEDLLKQFQEGHKNGLDMARQMDMIAELIARGVVSSEQAPDLLEIAPEMVDLNVELDSIN